jgi:hypothetical protein
MEGINVRPHSARSRSFDVPRLTVESHQRPTARRAHWPKLLSAYLIIQLAGYKVMSFGSLAPPNLPGVTLGP